MACSSTAAEQTPYTGHSRSVYANRFDDGTRDEICDRFEKETLPHLDVTPLRGKALGCWCYPERCHYDSLSREANEASRVRA